MTKPMTTRTEQTATYHPEDGGSLPYRLGVLLILQRDDGLIWVGERATPQPDGQQWQLPQGGIKAWLYADGSVAEQETAAQAALRELAEEVGDAVQATIIKLAPPLTYEFIDDKHPKYRGQQLTPVLLRYQRGNIDTTKLEVGETQPAFLTHTWQAPEQIRANVTAAKHALYTAAFSTLTPDILAYAQHPTPTLPPQNRPPPPTDDQPR
jgi:8-oxo-dGTP pyrophosphatase MutT (NUDIX family)